MTIAPNPHTAQRRPRGLTNRDLALMVLEEADRADTAESNLAALAPAAESWHRLASARGTFSAADAAKILSRDPAIALGQNRLFRTLADLRWAYRQRADRAWRARQRAVDRGWLTEVPQSHRHPRTGELVLDPPQLRVTLQGLAELRRRLGTAEPLKRDATRPEDNRP